jgi:hypothetical protein
METFSGIVQGIAVTLVTALTLHHLLYTKLPPKIGLPEIKLNKFSRTKDQIKQSV